MDCKEQHIVSKRKTLQYCLLGNTVLVVFMALCVSLLSKETTYFRFGPNSDLSIIGIPIDTYLKYCFVVGFILITAISNVVIGEMAMPIIGFNIYNPDKEVITEFGKLELQIYGNLMYTISSLKQLVITVMSVTQFDIALFGVIFCGLTSVFTIRILLNKKKFIK